MVNAELVKKWASRIAWAYSIISIVIVFITYISYNVFAAIPLTIQGVALYWFFIIIAIIYPISYLIYILLKKARLKKKVNDLLKNHNRITAYQASKLLKEPLWLVKNAFQDTKSGVIVEISGDTVYFSKKIINMIKNLYKEHKDLGKVSTELNKNKVVLTKKNIRIILDELLDRGDSDIIKIEDKWHKTEEKEEL